MKQSEDLNPLIPNSHILNFYLKHRKVQKKLRIQNLISNCL